MFNLSYQNVWLGAVGWLLSRGGDGAGRQSQQPGQLLLPWIPSSSKPGEEEGDKTEARDFGGGGGWMDGCLLIAGAGWTFGIQYNALLRGKVIGVGYLCAGLLAQYPGVIAK